MIGPQGLMMQVDPAEEEKRRLIMQQAGVGGPTLGQVAPPPPPQGMLPQQPQAPPPIQQQMQGPTLGGVTGQMQPPNLSQLEQQYETFRQLVERAYAPALIQPKSGESKGIGWHIGNALMFGQLGAAEQAYNQAYNQRAMKGNQAIKLKAAEEALSLTKAAAGIGAMDLGKQIQLANLNARIAQLGISNQNLELNKIRTGLDQFRAATSPVPTSEASLLAGRERGLVPRQVGGRVVWEPAEVQPGAEKYSPPAEGSPLASALGTRPGRQEPQTFTQKREQEAQIKVEAQTQLAQKKLEREQQLAVDPAIEVVKRLRDAVERAYSKEEGPLAAATIGRAKRTWGNWTGDPDMVRLGTLSGQIPTIIGGLGRDKRISDYEEAMMKEALPKPGDTLGRARVKINDMLNLLEKRRFKPPSSDEIGQSTAPTEPTPSTGSGITPGGIKYRVVQ